MNTLFVGARENFLTGKIDWMNGTIRAVLCSHAKTPPDISTDKTLADIAKCVVAKSPHFTGKTATNGVADADNISFASVQKGPRISSMVIYQEGASETSSLLIAYLDDLGKGTFPMLANGGDVQIVWANGPEKIFQI